MKTATHNTITKDQLTGIRQVAELNYLRIAPRKVRAVAGLIRGLPVREAEAQLLLSPHRSSRPLLKLLRSGVANAKNVRQLPSDRLMVEEIRVDQGPMLKRFMPRARGSASMIQKKMSHVTLVLAETKTARPERFTIAVEKKAKATARTQQQKAPSQKEEAVRPVQKQPGFFKRMFRRKSV